MKGRLIILKHTVSKFGRLTAVFLALLMIVTAMPLTSFAWGVEGQVCSSKFGDRYVGADGQNYYSTSTIDFIAYDSEGNATRQQKAGGNARKKYLLVEADGTERHVYCVESGIDFTRSDEGYTSASYANSQYFQNLPKTAREGIMLTTVYGWQEGLSTPVEGTNNDDFALATQIIIWEYQQQLRTSPTKIADNSYGIPANAYFQTIEGRPAEKCYNWLLEQMAKHQILPSFTGTTHTMKYDPNSKTYSITLTDTNNTYADLVLQGNSGITVSRSGNKYTFTSNKMLTSAVSVTARKNIPQVKDNMLIWGRPGKQTMMCGSEDPIRMVFSLKTETYGSAKIIKTAEDGAVSGIKFRITGNGVDTTIVTGSDGTISTSLMPGTYTVTELSENRYVDQASKTVTVSSNQTAEVSFSNTLKKGDLIIEKACDDGLVAGLKFRVTASVIGYDKTFETDANGRIVIEDLQVYDSRNNLITYQVDEVDTPIRYEAVAGQSSTLIYGGEVALKFNNTTKQKTARILKVSEDDDIVGKKFKVTSDNGYEATFATDENGGFVTGKLPVYNTENELIHYTVSEIETDDKYVQPESQSFTLENGDVTLKFNNILKKFRVEVIKTDSETGDRAQGDATLAGAKYGLFRNGELVDVFSTDANGYFITPYYPCGENNTWTLVEQTASEGYKVDPTEHKVGADPGLYTIEYNTTKNGVTEVVKKGSVAIIKHADTGETQIETPEEGATFEIFLKSAGSFENADESERDILVCDADGFAQSKHLPYGRYIIRQTKGWEDTEYMPDFEVYISEDEHVYKYLINNAPFTSYLKLVKVDSETGEEIPYAGAAFHLYDANGQRVVMHYTYPTLTEVDTFYTSAEGYLITPEKLGQGHFTLVEVQAPYGYTIRKEPIEFKIDDDLASYEDGITIVTVEFPNVPQKGTVGIKKTGEVFASVTTNGEAYLPVYEVQGLAGAKFNIVAAEDVYTPDGTLRYAAGTVVDTVVTGQNGEAVSKRLYLGRYRVVEVESPYGMILAEEQTVELVYAGQYVEITDVAVSFYNERQKVNIELEKVIEKDELFGVPGEDIQITFGLHAAEELKAADGSVIPADGLIEIIRVTEDGKFAFTVDIPFGSFYVKEMQTAGPEYLTDNTKYPVVFEYHGQDTAVVEIKVNDGNAIINEIIFGKVEGKKVDEFGEPLAGALIGLFRENETVFTTETALMTDVSESDGSFGFDGVAWGNWLIAEIEQPTGFILSLEVHHITISEDGQIIPVTMENEYIKGNVALTKYDADYPDHKLSGAEFMIYADVNGDGLLDEGDTFIDMMTETESGVYEYRDLIYGNYLGFESKSPEGFELDTNVYSFAILTDGETVVLENNAGVGFYNRAQRGDLIIEKSSEDGVLEGFEFIVEGEDFLGNPYSESFITDAEGRIEVSLRIGTYTVREAEDVDNIRYILPDAQTVEVKADEDSILGFENLLKKGSIEFKKVDKSTGEPLEGVGFAIYDAEKNLIAEGKTDAAGILRFDSIPYGNYFWQETSVLEGYQEAFGYHEFSITEDGQIITLEVENERIPDNLKTGDNSNLGLWFALLALSGTGLIAMVFTRKKRQPGA